MRRLRTRHEQDAIQVRTFHRRFGRGEVTPVDRIESAAEDANPHG
jgi:hypothetical protein